MDASNWIALGALVVSAIGLFFLCLERRDRKSQARALDQRMRRQEERQEIAYLGARQQDARAGVQRDAYIFSFTNAGPAVARSIKASVIHWDEELGYADTIATEAIKAAIPPGGEVASVIFDVPSELRESDLRLVASWDDDRGRHEDEEISRLRPPHAYRAEGF